jgi:hypothetical protein
MHTLIEDVFELSPDVRYVAVYENGRLESAERRGLEAASSTESDRYEELLVNPALLTLAGQRGKIDCGGLGFILIRYGNFFQLVLPLGSGHLSVAIEPQGEPLAIAGQAQRVVAEYGRRRAAARR